jgi:hypothetical protein
MSRIPLEKLYADWNDQARFEGVNGTKRTLKAADVANALGDFLELIRANKKVKLMPTLTDERTAWQRLACADEDSGCPEISTLLRAGWKSETIVEDFKVVIVLQKGK